MNDIRDQATDKLVKVQTEFESPCTADDPSEAYLEFKSGFEELGAECQTIDASTPHPKAHLIARQLERSIW